MLTVNEISIYPIKSLGGISISQSDVLEKGLRYDRRWMLIDSDNRFMTQRIFPQLALFKLFLHQAGFIIRYLDEEITLNTGNISESFRARIWNDEVEVIEVSTYHSTWFSSKLKMSCKLVYFPEPAARPVEENYARNNDHVSLADAYPLLIIGQSSLDDLNGRMKSPLPMNRFRPNIVFTGGKAFEEDEWSNFQIGNARFAAVKPCSRCVLTTVDQETGVKGPEPLVTLATYRKKENHIYFGQNLLVLEPGRISLGDQIIME
jgi:uncharacterized protein